MSYYNTTENYIWKNVKDYEGLYQISRNGLVYSFISNKILKPADNRGGYLYITLHKNGKKKSKYVHRLVAESFIGTSSLQVNHKDTNTYNNNLWNLEYLTPKQNTHHAIHCGVHRVVGENNSAAKHTEEFIRGVKNLLNTHSNKELALMFNLDYRYVWLLRTGKLWKHIKV